MKRVLFLGFVLLAACGGNKPSESVCGGLAQPLDGCNSSCDPSPGAPNTCMAGLHCSPDGKCDAACTATGGQCGSGNVCTADGRCEPGDTEPDAACPEVHLTGMRTTPTVELLLDQSGSMNDPYGNTNRWDALGDALVDSTNGVVKLLADRVVFGATLYSSRSQADATGRQVGIPPCPGLTFAKSTPRRQLNNFTAIQQLLQGEDPIEDTPTAESIDAIVADFATNPPAQGSPPIIVLATDGLPDTCADADPPATRQEAANQTSVMAAQRAFQAGIRLFFLFVGDDEAGDHPQQMANAGAGLDPATGNAKFFEATDPAALTTAFNDIIGGVLSCDVTLSSGISAADAPSGVVTVNGMQLTHNVDWTLDPDGRTIHIQGSACDMVKNAANPTIDATFPCGTIIF